ncbi:MAG: YhdH/YhfP family quinone oxidoreductase [Planctomycetaceae bacterium]
MADDTMACFLVRRDEHDQILAGPDRVGLADLPAGDVEIAVACSSLNFKDTLASTGNPRIVGELPHVPGIDAAGTVIASSDATLPVDADVLVTGYGLGAPAWGGWAERIRVPAGWVIPLPESLCCHRAMQLGTAGLTAALAIEAIQRADVTPASGPVLVTGATGGVGLLSVAILGRLGFEVVAATGKPEQHELLRRHGAAEIISREEVLEIGDSPLASARWAAAIDSVGGETLAAIVRTTRPRGCVAACGLVGGDELPLTVYPFLLRGVTLAGIDSASCPHPLRVELWNRLAGPWSPGDLEDATRDVPLEGLADCIARMQSGQHVGRTVVTISETP